MKVKKTGDRRGAGLYGERKALWRESDTVPEAGMMLKICCYDSRRAME